METISNLRKERETAFSHFCNESFDEIVPGINLHMLREGLITQVAHEISGQTL